MLKFLKVGYHFFSWWLWRRRVVGQWIARMESARKLFPSGYGWSSMRATADVVATIDQKLMFYTDPCGGAYRVYEVKAIRKYECYLLDLLEQQASAGDYPKIEADDVIEMLADYSEVQTERYSTILATLAGR